MKTTSKTKSQAPKAKAAGKPDLQEVFESLLPLLQAYEHKLTPRTLKEDTSRYELWCEKEMVIAGKPRHEMFFAGLIMQKDYVGFYYMPIYVNPSLSKLLKPELLKTLKGKSCFYIKNKTLPAAIKEALSVGFQLYKQQGWV